MYTYTIQHARPSGEAYVIEWDGEDINGICGPLDPHELKQAIRDIKDAGSFEYQPNDFGTTPDDWGFPVASYDPNEDS